MASTFEGAACCYAAARRADSERALADTLEDMADHFGGDTPPAERLAECWPLCAEGDRAAATAALRAVGEWQLLPFLRFDGFRVDVADGLRAVTASGTELPPADVQYCWALACERAEGAGGEPPLHPFAPLVRAWCKRPAGADVDRRPTGILPTHAGQRVNTRTLVRPADRLPADALALRPAHADGALWQDTIPGVGVVADAPAVLLALVESGSDARPGKAAALRDRLLVELLMAAQCDARTVDEARFVPLRDLDVGDLVAWLGWRRHNYRPNRADGGLALSRALYAASNVILPFGEHGGWRRVVDVPALPGLRLADRVTAFVLMVPGADKGALVDREALRMAGAVSAVAWRLLLAFSADWNRIAVGGELPMLTRPAMRRDKAGHLLDADGKIITGRRGQPLRGGSHPRAVATGQREPAPGVANLFTVYDGPSALVRLAWPLGRPSRTAHPKRTEEAAVRAALWLARERGADGKPVALSRKALLRPAIRIERLGKCAAANPHGFPWRVHRPYRVIDGEPDGQ